MPESALLHEDEAVEQWSDDEDEAEVDTTEDAASDQWEEHSLSPASRDSPEETDELTDDTDERRRGATDK